MPKISPIIKNVRDIIRQDRGVSSNAQRLEQLGWMLFLKILEDKMPVPRPWWFVPTGQRALLTRRCELA